LGLLLEFQKEGTVADVEIVARVERRRKWSEREKAALLAEVDAAGGKVSVVARRHRVAESLLYNWRAARKAAASATAAGEMGPLAFVPIGVVGRADDGGPALLAAPQAARADRPEAPLAQERVGMIELELPGGTRLRVDAFVDGTALRRVLLALKGVA
jgi:transposase